MSYGAEAVILVETGFPTLRTQLFNSNDNDKLLERSLDLIEERRENAMVQLAYYQHKLKQGYDARVRLKPTSWGIWYSCLKSPIFKGESTRLVNLPI